jgi:ribosomal-protein-alanine N-acetyltransferase
LTLKSSIYLRAPDARDRRAFLAAVQISAGLHRPWINAPSTTLGFHAYLKKMAEPPNHAYLVCRRDTGQMAGVINLTNVIMGPFRSGFLGYYAFAGQQQQGFMRDGLKAVVREAFRTLKMHRLEANIQPGNRASVALARSCGFTQEGFSPRYLKIGGRWRDHERWAIVAS